MSSFPDELVNNLIKELVISGIKEKSEYISHFYFDEDKTLTHNSPNAQSYMMQSISLDDISNASAIINNIGATSLFAECLDRFILYKISKDLSIWDKSNKYHIFDDIKLLDAILYACAYDKRNDNTIYISSKKYFESMCAYDNYTNYKNIKIEPSSRLDDDHNIVIVMLGKTKLNYNIEIANNTDVHNNYNCDIVLTLQYDVNELDYNGLRNGNHFGIIEQLRECK